MFDRTGDGRAIKCLTLVDDATHEAVAIEVERAISGQMLTRVLDRLALSRGLPRVIRTDNDKQFCGKAMVEWGHVRGVDRRLIEPGKPNHNAYASRSTGDCATNASTSTGAPACCRRGRLSKSGVANTTTKDPRKHSAN